MMQSELIELRPPETSFPMWARPGETDLRVFDQIFGRHEYGFARAGEQPTTILDVGANVGYASAYFASVFPTASVIAVEPEPSNLELAAKNLASCSNVQIVSGALWPRSVELSIGNPNAPKWAFQMREEPPKPNETTVRGVTMDDLFSIAGVDTVDLVKIDIEGGELSVFAEGSIDWLERTRCIAVEIHEAWVPGCRPAVFNAFNRCGHRFERTVSGENHVFVNKRLT